VQYYYTTARTCLVGYYNVNDLIATLTLTLRFITLNKGILWSFWSIPNWTGPYAKWIDQFQLSAPETINLYKIHEKMEKDAYFIGSTDASTCYPGLFWTNSPFGEVLAQTQNNLVWYIQQKLMPLKENGSWD